MATALANAAAAALGDDMHTKEELVYRHKCSWWCSAPWKFNVLLIIVVFAMYAGISAYAEIANMKADFDDKVTKAVEKNFGLDPV